jgi:glycopeptide antibiotics resistance protein
LQKELQRNRIIYAVCVLIVILLGLVSRSGSPLIPTFLEEYAGDTLWALVAFLMFGFLFPRFSTVKVAAIAALFSLAVEISQLYHAAWIDAIRRTRLGGLVLGFGFMWSDLVCYAAGIGIGVLLERCGMSRIFSGNRVRFQSKIE